MKKILCFKLLFFIAISGLFSVDITELEPEEILYAILGNKDSNISLISTIGGNLYPERFVVDKTGIIYLNDINIDGISAILVFNSNGTFNRRIVIGNKLDGIWKLGLYSDDSLLISDNTKILRLTTGDNFENIKLISHYLEEPELWNFIVVGDDIIIRDKNRNFKIIDSQVNKLNILGNDSETHSPNFGIYPETESQKKFDKNTFIDKRGFFFSDYIEKMIQMDNGSINTSTTEGISLKEEDFVPFEYDVPKLLYFGMDKDGNTYWCYRGRGEFIATIFVYNQSGKTLIKFNTISKGDIKTCGYKPYVDYYGNIYVMPVWRDLGVKVYKYERQW